jgi:branched-chain amino acid transport system permease protein
MSYVIHILVLLCIYEILIVSLNPVVGYGGMLSLCYAAFYGIGAYVSTLLMMRLGWPFELSFVSAVLFVGGAAYLIARVFIRFHGDFFS